MSNGMYHPNAGYAQQRQTQDPRIANPNGYPARYPDTVQPRIPVSQAGAGQGVGGTNAYGSRYAQEPVERRDYPTSTNNHNINDHRRMDPPRTYGSNEPYLSAASVASNHTAPTSAASIAGYRSMAEDAHYNNGGTSKGYAQGGQVAGYASNAHNPTPVSTQGERAYVPRHLQHPVRESPASGLPVLASASEVAQTYERRQQASSAAPCRAEHQPARQSLERPAKAGSASISPSYTPARAVPDTVNHNQNNNNSSKNSRSNNLAPPANRQATQTYAQAPRATATSVSPAVPGAPTRTANTPSTQKRLNQAWVGERSRAGQSTNDTATGRYNPSSSQGQHQHHPAAGHVPMHEDDAYPVAPSPAYDPVIFERIIGLSDEPPSVETPRAYEVVETESDRRAAKERPRESGAADKEKDQAVHAARHGISPSLLLSASKAAGKADSTRLQALVRATEPGQLEAWNRETEGDPPSTAAQAQNRTEGEGEASEQNAGSGSEPPAGNTGEGSKRVRVRKPKPRKGEPGWVPRHRRTKAELAADAAAKLAAAEAALQAEKEAAADPFNSLTAHLAAYVQGDKALLREGAGYGKIPDLSPQEILVRQRQAAVREAQRAAEEKRKEEQRVLREAREAKEAARAAGEEAQRLALLEAARPAENDGQGGLMDIDLSGFGDIDADVDEEADYEAQRQARIAHNNRIMAALGLGEIIQPSADEVEPTPVKRGRGRPSVKVPKRKREPRYSPDGTTADSCPVGSRQRLAFIEIPQVFRSQRVQDLFRYSQLPPVPENPIEIESESEDEPVEAVAVPFGPKNRAEILPPIHHSQIDGDPCHQCRRKSNKPKMSCRNKDPQCNNKYCISCVQRYNFPFEEYSRTFICPRCQGYCNCSACLRSSGLLKLLKLDENQDKLRMSLNAAKTAPNIQVYLEMMGAPKAPPMPQQELHRIRFIHKEEDIITPEIPDDVLSELMARHHKRKHYAKAGVGPKKAKKKAKTKSTEDAGEAHHDQAPATARPTPRKRKGKERADETPAEPVGTEPETASQTQAYVEQAAPEDSDEMSDDEEAAYAAAQNRYSTQYDYGTGESRRPPASSLDGPGCQDQHYAIANAWSVYRA